MFKEWQLIAKIWLACLKDGDSKKKKIETRTHKQVHSYVYIIHIIRIHISNIMPGGKTMKITMSTTKKGFRFTYTIRMKIQLA